jgi:mRNA interferase HigB
MRVISRRSLREFWEKHSTAKNSLLLWYDRITKSDLENFAQLRQLFPWC